ncbi:glucan biosynthesis protein [Salinimonas chungwhensis]|uniref:glucan biosynthesis protein n=1 Tax=Salinimonas chungwhensis TaxID=265425 RepID=UPI00037C7D96|nr:glucan biosynthesis protein G [Salinimonas chungwhensis]
MQQRRFTTLAFFRGAFAYNARNLLSGHTRFSRWLTSVLIIIVGVSSAHANAEAVGKSNLPDNKPILQSVIEQARKSAQESYVADDHGLDDQLKNMDYQAYKAIHFKPEQALWKDDSPYNIQFFHPGFLYDEPVTVNIVERDNSTRLLPFDANMFRYEKKAKEVRGLTDEKSGYAGFRVHYPLNKNDYKDEFAVFQGASYFRLIGKDQVYGISARGLAIDTAMPEGEEFPRFTEFWLIKPSSAESLTIYARLESPSVAGAYAFTLYPGKSTKADVKAWLFARQDIDKLGIAPFTSMFLYGENTEQRHDDYRPEVHDSDGVLMITEAGEQIWRPLTNPSRLQITALSDTAPQAFGMLQRDGSFNSYLDAEANYHARPGLWVKPKAGFGKGKLEVVEIPTDAEIHDNIVAYWVPEKGLKEGQSRYFSYGLRTVDKEPKLYDKAVVTRTRQGVSHLPGFESSEEQTVRRFVVDFTLPRGFSLDTDEIDLILNASRGTVQQARIFKVNGNSEMRATFLLMPDSQKTVDMRLFLNHQDKQISEVWNYVYQPE